MGRSPPQGIPAGGAWTEDSDSPHTLSGDTSYTLDIATVRDQMWVSGFDLATTGNVASPPAVEIRINEVSGSGTYERRLNDGTEDSGDAAGIAGYDTNDNPVSFDIYVDGRWNGDCTASLLDRAGNTFTEAGDWPIAEGFFVNATSPIASVTIITDSDFDEMTGTVEIRGRDSS